MNEKPEIYMHQFESKDDITNEFGIDESSLSDCHIYLAYYHQGDYGCDSSTFVLYEDSNGNLKEVNGGHCSCHGLEGQWEPEEVTVEALDHRLEHGSLGNVGGYDNDGYAQESRVVVDYLIAKGKETDLSAKDKILIYGLSEIARALGVAQASDDKEAEAEWKERLLIAEENLKQRLKKGS